jgi:predicted nucleic acid-binding protein
VIVVDASVLIGHLDEADAQHDGASALLTEAANSPLGASTITIAEVLVGPVRTGWLQAARAALEALELTEVPLGSGASERLASLRAKTNLKLPDCCVLLAADDAGADAILTLDDRLGAQAAQLGLGAGSSHRPKRSRQ